MSNVRDGERLLGPEQALDLANGVLEAAPSVPGLEVEVTVESTVDAFARYAKEGPTQSADRDRVDVALRVRLQGEGGVREARVECVAPEKESYAGLYERALELAGVSPVDADAPALGGAVALAPERSKTALDLATLEHGFDEKAAWIARALEACRGEGLAGAGLVRTTSVGRALVNSAGRSVYGTRQRASASLTTVDVKDGVEGFGESIAARASELEGDEAIRAAVEKASRGRGPSSHAPDEEVCVLEPHAVSSLLYFAAEFGFGAREFAEGSSFLSGRIGEKAFSELVTLDDDVHGELYPGLPFDGEGTPRLSTRLVDRGKLVGPVTDARTSKRLGLACTGHAPPQPSGEGPLPEILVLSPGDESLQELIAGVERGLLVTQFHYVNAIDKKELVLTGMTRSGTFRIENGKVTAPVRNLRFTDALPRILSRVSGVGSRARVAGSLFQGELICPALRVDGLRFTSGTEF